jgi:tetratricopeptide (TPR) repeat protein
LLLSHLQSYLTTSPGKFLFLQTPPCLITDQGRYFHQRGKSEDHESFAPLSQHIVESQSPQNREVRLLLAAIHYCRGSEASESNQPEPCLQHFKEHLALRQNFCDETGKPDEDLASAYNELGVAYMMNKMYVEGMHAFEKSIEIYQGLEDYSGAMTAFPCTNLGLSYWLQGQHKMAEQILLDALHDREAWFGEMDRESLKLVTE